MDVTFTDGVTRIGIKGGAYFVSVNGSAWEPVSDERARAILDRMAA